MKAFQPQTLLKKVNLHKINKEEYLEEKRVRIRTVQGESAVRERGESKDWSLQLRLQD